MLCRFWIIAIIPILQTKIKLIKGYLWNSHKNFWDVKIFRENAPHAFFSKYIFILQRIYSIFFCRNISNVTGTMMLRWKTRCANDTLISEFSSYIFMNRLIRLKISNRWWFLGIKQHLQLCGFSDGRKEHCFNKYKYI